MLGNGVPFNGDIFMEKEFLSLKDKYKITHVIETGTHHGYTTSWLADNFKQVRTLEINPEYLKLTYPQIGKKENVLTLQCSSAEHLITAIRDWNDVPLLVFLDAHWSANPVLRELDQIKESGIKPILVIHDFKVPDHPELGYDKYPAQGIVYEWNWISEKVDAIYGVGGYRYYYNSEATGAKRGCVFIIPKHA